MANQISNSAMNDDAWGDCPTGELSKMVNHLNTRDRNQQFAAAAKTGLTVAAGVAMLVVAVGLMNTTPGTVNNNQVANTEAAMMDCAGCIANFDALHAHVTTGEAMDAELLAQVTMHLEKCESCRNKYDGMNPGELAKLLAENIKAGFQQTASLLASAFAAR